MKTGIPYATQSIDEHDIASVVAALRSDFLTQGGACDTFELMIAETTRSNFCCCVSSASAALHLTYLALGIEKGDLIWTSPNTFVATANMALLAGAEIDFVDVDHTTGNLCPKALENKLYNAKRTGRLPKIITVVHFGGSSADMHTIHKLCAGLDIKIVEDASHAMGGVYRKEPVGSCRFSDAAIFSFHPVKMITTGEGGCITSNSKQLIELTKSLRSHGITKQADQFKNTTHGGWYYEQHRLGLNYRLTDFQAALGISQLARLPTFLERRNEIATTYDLHLSTDLVRPSIPKNVTSSFHLYPVQVKESSTRKDLYDYLHSRNVYAQVHYIPVHMHPFFQARGFTIGQFPNAELFYSKSLSLPMFPSLTDKELGYVIKTVNDGLIA